MLAELVARPYCLFKCNKICLNYSQNNKKHDLPIITRYYLCLSNFSRKGKRFIESYIICVHYSIYRDNPVNRLEPWFLFKWQL